MNSGRNILLYQFMRRAMKMAVVNVEEYYYYELHTKLYPFSRG
jgi:hypothetical protein